MAQFQYLKPENLADVFSTSQQYTESLTENFREYERIARNKPHPSIPKEYPKTTDGTTASIIRKTPHRIISQLPTGTVISTTDDWLAVVAEFIYLNKIIPTANKDYALLQKCWTVVERFLTFGACPTYTPFLDHHGYYCTDLSLPYWGDVFLQPGKLSDEDSSYIFMRSWWQTSDIDALIDAQKKIDKDKRTWDIKALEAVKKIETTKDEKAKTPMEREHSVNTKGGIELITGFQRGVGAKFYTFHVQTTGEGDKKVKSGTIVRTKVNKDPRGEIPISFAYGDTDGTNPLGRSIVDLVGGLQNLMDGEMQMYQYNRALMLNPPLLKKGNWNKNKAKFVPNAIIDLGTGEQNSLEPLQIDSTALSNFTDNYGLMKSQLLNLLASPDASVSAESGNPGFSKTDAGVKQIDANVSVDDNYVRKQFGTWFERWSETAINLFFAERTGIEELQLDKESAEKLRKLAEEGKFDPSQLSEDNKIRINYDTATPALKFEVDASTSKMQDEVKQLQSLSGVKDVLESSKLFQEVVPMENVMELWNAIVNASGVENPEDLILDEKDKQEAAQKAEEQRQAKLEAEKAQSQNQLHQEDTKQIINYKDAPESIKRQMEQGEGFEPAQEVSPGQQMIDQKAQASQSEPESLTPEHVLKADQQAHDQEMDKARLALETKQANKPDPKPESATMKKDKGNK